MEEDAAGLDSGVVTALSDYLARVSSTGLPGNVMQKARLHVLDTFAAMVSGSAMNAGRGAIRYLERWAGRGDATVIGSRLLVSPADAALANGMMGHADETDDSHLAGRFHPGCGIVASALAMAEAQASSGIEFLRAVVAGYDVGARIALSLGLEPTERPRHSTHTLAANFGAAAAAASLAHLRPPQIAHVFSYAAQQASGIPFWQRDSEHMEKAFDFGGMGARNGITAAALVASGCSAVANPFAGRDSFFSAFAVRPDPASLVQELGSRFEILRASLKKWSVGSPIQAALDALDALMRQQSLPPDSITRITVTLPDDRIHLVSNRAMPNLCVQHLLALMLVQQKLTFESCHDPSLMDDAAVRNLRSRIVAIASPQLTLAVPARQAIVEIETSDGRKLRHHASAVRGTPENPMDEEEVVRKANGLMAPVLGDAQTTDLIAHLRGVDRLPSILSLRPLLQR